MIALHYKASLSVNGLPRMLIGERESRERSVKRDTKGKNPFGGVTGGVPR
jgi:hypothetical protein